MLLSMIDVMTSYCRQIQSICMSLEVFYGSRITVLEEMTRLHITSDTFYRPEFRTLKYYT